MTRVAVTHILINIFLFLNIGTSGEMQKQWRVANIRSLVRYFTGAIGLDEDEFLERFFYDHTCRSVAGCKSQSETGN